MMGTKESYKQRTEGGRAVNKGLLDFLSYDVQDVQQVSVLYIMFRKHLDIFKLII